MAQPKQKQRQSFLTQPGQCFIAHTHHTWPHIIWDLQDTTSPWVFAAVAFLISPPAVLLNALIIIAVKRRRELKRTSNILLSSLAVTDLLVGSLCVPLSAVVRLLVSYQILADHYICVLDFVAISSTVILTICSIFHLTMMAWERYTWPFENGLTTKWWWLKALWKSWR